MYRIKAVLSAEVNITHIQILVKIHCRCDIFYFKIQFFILMSITEGLFCQKVLACQIYPIWFLPLGFYLYNCKSYAKAGGKQEKQFTVAYSEEKNRYKYLRWWFFSIEGKAYEVRHFSLRKK